MMLPDSRALYYKSIAKNNDTISDEVDFGKYIKPGG